ncbi:MAG: M6 family metalloprotease domain-containing protein [Ignavibacteriales bacterium]|nr:M6 family metalloprotease domain-containing protein [Ignavibacteriales bacterium]
MLSRGLLLVACLFIIAMLQAAPLRNYPQTLTQPDGLVVHCFTTGDEYYHWLHDKENYTIVQNDNGYYVYAVMGKNGTVLPSSYVAGVTDPKSVGLKPGVTISAAAMTARRNKILSTAPEGIGMAPSKGTINNIVVFVRFSDDAEFNDPISTYNSMFNGSSAGINSMNAYFQEVSYNKLTITSTFYPTPGTIVVSFRDSHPRSYYRPYTSSNPTGYTDDAGSTTREHTLLQSAINAISASVPATLAIDSDNDGRVDNVCFIVAGDVDGWNDLLWPHRWSLYTVTATINGKRVWDYNFQIQKMLSNSNYGVGVLCHEMFHSVGSPDLYHYTDNGIDSMGPWDVMDGTRNPAQHMTAYMKMRYGKWIDSIPTILTGGSYTINSMQSATGNAYKILSPNSTTEYFVVEFRKRIGAFENSLPGSGLIMYRINKLRDGLGNRNGPPDEVYVYRPSGTTTVNGSVNSAYLSSDVGRTLIMDGGSTAPFLNSGANGGVKLTDIGSSSGTTISFTVRRITPPILAVATSASFPNTIKGDSAIVTLQIVSASDSALMLNSVTNKLSIFKYTAPVPQKINSLDTLKLRIVFMPVAFGTFTDTITINSDGGTAKVLLTGTSPSPTIGTSATVLSFGDVARNASKQLSLRISNTSINRLGVDTIYTKTSVLLPNRASLSIASLDSITVTFSPVSVGSVVDTLFLRNNSSTALVKIPLSGNSPAPMMSVAKTRLDFAATVRGDSSIIPLVVKNGSVNSLTIGSIVTGSAHIFAKVTTPIVVKGIDSVLVNVMFKPIAFGLVADTLAIISDGGIAKIVLSGTSPFPVMVVSKAGLAFGDAAKNGTKADSLTIRNTSINSLSIDSIWTTKSVFKANRTTGIEIGGDSLKLVVSFSPDKTGAFADTLYLKNNSLTPLVKIPLSGNAPASGIAVGKTRLDFPATVRGDSSALSLVVKNTSVSNLTISGIATGSGLFCFREITPLVVKGVDSITMAVIFTPTAFGSIVDTLNINSDGGIAKIVMSGTSPYPALVAAKTVLFFGDIAKGGTKLDSLTIRNSSINALSVDSIWTSTSIFKAAKFAGVLKGGDSLRTVVAFSPDRMGTFADTLHLRNNSQLPIVKIALSGSSPFPAISFVGSFDCGSQKKGQSTTKQLKITNTSINQLVIDSVILTSRVFVFSGMTFPATIKSTDSLNVSLKFTPDSVRSYSDTMYFYSNSVSPYRVTLAGVGTPATGVAREGDVIPMMFSLSQNFPNPFNPSTTIIFGIPNSANVSLKIYDIVGREIGELVNEELSAGYYRYQFSAHGLASGMYLYRFSAASTEDGRKSTFRDVKKFLLLK